MPDTPDQTALLNRIADIATPFLANFSDEEAAKVNAKELAAAVMAVLPEQTDRDAEAPAAECSAQNRNYESGPRLCIRAAQHHGDHIDGRGFHWSDTVAVYPVSDGTFRRGTDVRALLRRVAAEEQPAETRQSCACGQDGGEYCDVDEAVGEQPAETETQKPPTEADIVRAHVLTVHQIGEQLAGVESWMWEHLANVRDAAPERPAVGEQPEMQEARPECAHCWREIENRGHNRWVHIPGGFEPCIPQKTGSPRAEPRTTEPREAP